MIAGSVIFRECMYSTAIMWQTRANTKYCWSQMIGCCEANVKARSPESHGIRDFLAFAPVTKNPHIHIPLCPHYIPVLYPRKTNEYKWLETIVHPSISPEPHKYIPITSPFFQWWPCLAKGQRHQASEAACGRLWQILAGCRVKIMGTVQYNGILTYTSYDIIDPYNHFSMELLASSGMGGKLLVSVNYQKPFKSCVFWKLERSTRNVTWSPSSTLGTQKIGLAHTHPDTHIGRAFTEITEPLAVTKHLADLWISKASMMGLQPTPPTSCGTRGKKNCWSSWNLSYQNTVPVSRFNVSCGASGESTASTWNSQLHPLTRWCVECGSWGEWWMAIMGKTLALILKYKEIIFIRTTYERPTGECSSSSLIEDHGCWNMWAGFTTLWHPLMLAG